MNCILANTIRADISRETDPQIRNATPYSTHDAGKVDPSPCSPSSEDDSIIIDRRTLSSVAEDIVIRG